LACSAAVLLLASLAALYASRAGKNKIAFKARDWVLITDFDNRTGEPVLNGTLEYALERELSNSRFVNVVPRERVEDALRLMRKPLETKIDAAVGREICLRDGGIPAMLTGRVERFGSTYTLSAQLVDPIRGVTLASLSEDDPAESQMAGAVHRLSNRMREKLGEQPSLIQQTEANLEKVTTPSLKALQLYSRAIADIERDKWESAASLLEQALAEDPNFASAHTLLANCYSNFKRDKQAAPHYQKAFELADATTDRERYFIQGSYYAFHRDPDRAIQAYEALVHLYPDDFWGVENLTPLYWGSGRWGDEEEMAIRRADLRPASIRFNFGAGYVQLRMGHFAGAKRYFARAQALITPETRESNPDMIASLEFVPVWELMRNGDVEQALGETDRLAETFELRRGGTLAGLPALATPDARSVLAKVEGNQYLKLGKLKAAEHWYQRESRSDAGSLDLSNVAWAEGNREAARRALLHFLALRPVPSLDYQAFQIDAKLCAELGLLSELRELIVRAEKDGWPPKFQVQYAKGALALAEGHNAQAILHLRGTVDTLQGLQFSPFTSMAEDLLATALEKQGDVASAIDALKPMELNDVDGPDLDARYHLARLYRKVGNKDEAQKIETDLLKRLKYADPDHPILRELQKRNPLAAAVSPK
jgi:tetratricopeptide (TPR) repeat protein